MSSDDEESLWSLDECAAWMKWGRLESARVSTSASAPLRLDFHAPNIHQRRRGSSHLHLASANITSSETLSHSCVDESCRALTCANLRSGPAPRR